MVASLRRGLWTSARSSRRLRPGPQHTRAFGERADRRGAHDGHTRTSETTSGRAGGLGRTRDARRCRFDMVGRRETPARSRLPKRRQDHRRPECEWRRWHGRTSGAARGHALRSGSAREALRDRPDRPVELAAERLQSANARLPSIELSGHRSWADDILEQDRAENHPVRSSIGRAAVSCSHRFRVRMTGQYRALNYRS